MGIADGTKGLARQTGQNKAHPYTPGGTQPSPTTSAAGGGGGGGGGGGAVSSVFGRTGAVTATSGDYTVSEVTGAAPLASPALTGVPTAPTASPGTSTTQIATTAFVEANALIPAGTAKAGDFLKYSFYFPAWTATSVDPLNPLDFGGFGNGSSHPITSTDITIYGPGWLGTYTAGTEWDTVAIQECIYAAYGTPANPNSVPNMGLNRAVYIPAGLWLINVPILITKVIGGNITGAGCFATTLRNQVTGVCVQINGMSYSYFGDMQIEQNASVPNPTGILLDYDWDQATTHGWSAASQSNTFFNLNLSGEGQYPPTDPTFPNQMHVQIGISVAATGSGSQCSENLFIGCRYIWCEFGWNSGGQNALQNNHIGGNFENCRLAGIRYGAGMGSIYGVGFQNSNGVGWGQVAFGGFDIVYNNAANDAATVEGCRTESPQFITVASDAYVSVKNCNIVPFIANWQASHTYAAGTIVTGPGDGVPYFCDTGGTSATTQTAPTWSSAHTGANSIVDGTAKWHAYAVTPAFSGSSYENCIFQWGQVQPNATIQQTRYKNCSVSRVDWYLTSLSTGGGSTPGVLNFTIDDVTLNLGGGPNTGSPNTPYRIAGIGQTFHNHTLHGPDHAILWASPFLSSDVGISKADLTNPYLAIYGALTLRTPLQSDFQTYNTDTGNKDLVLMGGLSTGAAAGGGVSLQICAPGPSGALLNQPFEQLRADTNGVTLANASTPLSHHYSFTFPWTPGAILTGTFASVVTSLYGVVPGDVVTAAFTDGTAVGPVAGLIITATVTAPDQVTVVIYNATLSTQTLAAGTVRIDTFLHVGLVATQSASADCAQLAADLGGSTNFYGFWDARISANVTTSGGNATNVTDALGGAVALTPASGTVGYDGTGLLFNITSAASLVTPTDSALDITAHTLTVVYIGTAINGSGSNEPFVGVLGGSQQLGFGFDVGVTPPAVQLLGVAHVSPTLIGSTSRRLMVAARSSGLSSTATGIIYDANTVSGTNATSTTSPLFCIGSNGGSSGMKMKVRAAIVYKGILTATQNGYLRNWAVAKHSIQLTST